MQDFCARTRFEGLEIIEVEPGTDDVGWVTFRAILAVDDEDASFTERSRFERDGDKWKYVEGEDID